MIQAAHCGIGIEGKEGKQASLAADFSITQFKHIGRLLMVHGRNSYKRSAALGQFVMHRGMIISAMQAVFSSVFFFASVPLYQGFLMVGYATIYTMFPVFSLVLDQDVKPEMALLYPELYKDLTKGRSLSFKTFLIWVLISVYQGGILMYGALVLFESEFVHVVAISFTALILTELLMVALTIRTWHWLMVVAEFSSLGCYLASLAFLNEYFDLSFITTWPFLWKVSAITLVSCLPLYIIKYLKRKFSPPSYSKLSSTLGTWSLSSRDQRLRDTGALCWAFRERLLGVVPELHAGSGRESDTGSGDSSLGRSQATGPHNRKQSRGFRQSAGAERRTLMGDRKSDCSGFRGLEPWKEEPVEAFSTSLPPNHVIPGRRFHRPLCGHMAGMDGLSESRHVTSVISETTGPAARCQTGPDLPNIAAAQPAGAEERERERGRTPTTGERPLENPMKILSSAC
ncbi:unnamed protein product [Pleuronectes platessa]|uniref:P-type ATPase C-terminal domain-containing protein n=1 Tax=Pleuronectes platessa TaxID=8262 RepID=A0A9N7Z2C2_PLEPL|nr:unnamed protein product [Pleuronectes platessa]